MRCCKANCGKRAVFKFDWKGNVVVPLCYPCGEQLIERGAEWTFMPKAKVPSARYKKPHETVDPSA